MVGNVATMVKKEKNAYRTSAGKALEKAAWKIEVLLRVYAIGFRKIQGGSNMTGTICV